MYVVSTVIIVAFPLAYVSCATLQDTHNKQIKKNKVTNFFITLTFVYIAKIVIIFNLAKCFTIFNFLFHVEHLLSCSWCKSKNVPKIYGKC